jgi:hypothetical protein
MGDKVIIYSGVKSTTGKNSFREEKMEGEDGNGR